MTTRFAHADGFSSSAGRKFLKSGKYSSLRLLSSLPLLPYKGLTKALNSTPPHRTSTA